MAATENLSISDAFPRKNSTAVWFQAFELFWKKNKNTWLIIIGGAGNLYEQTCQLAKNSAAGSHIILLRSIRNPMPILKASDLLVLSSDYEGLPVVLFEAAVLGVPFVATMSREHAAFVRTMAECWKSFCLGCFERYGGLWKGRMQGTKRLIAGKNNRKSLELFENPFCRRPETKREKRLQQEKRCAARKLYYERK